MLRHFVHYGIHFLVPIAIGMFFFKENRTKAILVLWAGILLDLDHLLASPIFDVNRCSINFHLLHTYWAVIVYFILLFWKKTRLLGLAFILHMIADAIDCLFL